MPSPGHRKEGDACFLLLRCLPLLGCQECLYNQPYTGDRDVQATEMGCIGYRNGVLGMLIQPGHIQATENLACTLYMCHPQI